jgi:hypothetical protein
MKSLLPDSSKYDLSRQLQACQSKSRRNGKVARLSAPLHEQINRLIEDGVPYKVIIERLGEAGKHLNEDNISNWRLGGYQDYRKAQVIHDRACVQAQAAADVVRDTGDIDLLKLQQVCNEIAMLQYLGALMEHGKELVQASIKKNPAKMITLINSCSSLSEAKLKLMQTDIHHASAPRTTSPNPNPSEPNRT